MSSVHTTSAEGGPEGTYNEMMALNGIVGKADQMMDHIEAWGDPTTFPHFAIGWAWAGDTPFQWTKQIASHFGGTRNGMVKASAGLVMTAILPTRRRWRRRLAGKPRYSVRRP